MFLLLLLVGSIYGSSITQKREKIFSDIAKEIQELSPGRSNATNFTSTDLRAVFNKLGFKNCSSEVVTKNCQRVCSSKLIFNHIGLIFGLSDCFF